MRATNPDAHRGQATVEFALVLPFVAALAGCVVAVTAVCLDVLALNDLARNCARAAAVSADPTSTAVHAVGGRRVAVSTVVESGTVTVTLRRVVNLRVPLIGRIGLGAPVSATATMLLEPPDSHVP